MVNYCIIFRDDETSEKTIVNEDKYDKHTILSIFIEEMDQMNIFDYSVSIDKTKNKIIVKIERDPFDYVNEVICLKGTDKDIEIVEKIGLALKRIIDGETDKEKLLEYRIKVEDNLICIYDKKEE